MPYGVSPCVIVDLRPPARRFVTGLGLVPHVAIPPVETRGINVDWLDSGVTAKLARPRPHVSTSCIEHNILADPATRLSQDWTACCFMHTMRIHVFDEATHVEATR